MVSAFIRSQPGQGPRSPAVSAAASTGRHTDPGSRIRLTSFGRTLPVTVLALIAALLVLRLPGPTVTVVAGERAAGAGDRLLIHWRASVSVQQRTLAGLDFAVPVRELPPIGATAVRVTGPDVAAARLQLASDPRIESVEPDALVYSAMTPNDQLYPRQWALRMMQVPWAWEMAQGSSKVTVAVLDSGVDLSHPDLAAHLTGIGCNTVADFICPADGHGTPPADDDGHGSQVAGIISAVTDNQEGVAGVAWNASMLPVKVTRQGVGTEDAFIAGLLWSVDHGARVLNFSFSEDCGQAESQAMRDALAYAWNHGALLVAAAGNAPLCPAGVFPAADPHVLAVAATDMNDRPLADSNFGPWVRAAAPGDRIYTTSSDHQYATGSGTSYAAPQVAGLAAMLFSVQGATNVSVTNWILSTCDVPNGWNPAYGCGRINAFRAVSLAVKGVDPHGTPPSTVTVHLNRGWNNLLYQGPTRQIDTALASLKGRYGSLYQWDPAQGVWGVYLAGQPVASDLQVIEERGAYWLYMNLEADFGMSPTGTSLPPQLTLPHGWNNLALSPGPLPAMLQQFSTSVASVFSWNAQNALWNGFFPGNPAPSDLESVKANTAYWVFAPGRLVVHLDGR